MILNFVPFVLFVDFLFLSLCPSASLREMPFILSGGRWQTVTVCIPFRLIVEISS
jgi:hypothetical protein